MTFEENYEENNYEGRKKKIEKNNNNKGKKQKDRETLSTTQTLLASFNAKLIL